MNQGVTGAVVEKSIPVFEAIRIGFFTNILNPKASLFFLGVFTQVIDSSTPILVQLVYGIEMTVVTLMWFVFLSILIFRSRSSFQSPKIQNFIEKSLGIFLVSLGLSVAFT